MRFLHAVGLPRRDFLLGAAGVGAAAALCGCAAHGDPASPGPTPTPAPPGSSTQLVPGPSAPFRDDFGAPTQWGLDMPGIVSTVATQPGVRTLALTFDACGGPLGSGYDEALIATLREHRVAATLFINQRWADKHPQLTEEFLADPLFTVENHGTRHLPLSTTGASAYGIAGTTSPADAREEVVANQRFLAERFHHTPQWFRSGTAHYDAAAVRMVESLGDAGRRIPREHGRWRHLPSSDGDTSPPRCPRRRDLHRTHEPTTVRHRRRSEAGTRDPRHRAAPGPVGHARLGGGGKSWQEKGSRGRRGVVGKGEREEVRGYDETRLGERPAQSPATDPTEPHRETLRLTEIPQSEHPEAEGDATP